MDPGYLRTRPTPHSSSKSLGKSNPHTDPGPGCFSLPPNQRSELLRATSSFKPRRESRMLRSAVPSTASICCFCCCWTIGPRSLTTRRIAEHIRFRAAFPSVLLLAVCIVLAIMAQTEVAKERTRAKNSRTRIHLAGVDTRYSAQTTGADVG